jgi:hypothetical protein
MIGQSIQVYSSRVGVVGERGYLGLKKGDILENDWLNVRNSKPVMTNV